MRLDSGTLRIWCLCQQPMWALITPLWRRAAPHSSLFSPATATVTSLLQLVSCAGSCWRWWW